MRVLGFRFGHEGYVPSEFERLGDFVGVKVALEGLFPDIDGERREPKRFAEAVHVGDEAGLFQAAGYPIDMIGFEVGTRAPGHLMALARRWRFAAEISVDIPGPQIRVFEEMGDTVGSLWSFEVVRELVVLVVEGNPDRKRLKFSCKGIERRGRT